MSWKSWEVWLHGARGALIGGIAGGVTAGLAASLIDPNAFNLTNGWKDTMGLTGIVFLVSGFASASLYLKPSPYWRPRLVVEKGERKTAGSDVRGAFSGRPAEMPFLIRKDSRPAR